MTDWFGFIVFAVCELGVGSMDSAWRMAPQEWWSCFSFKYGKRRAIMEGKRPDDETLDELSEELTQLLEQQGRSRE